jgi:hypothetical protein
MTRRVECPTTTAASRTRSPDRRSSSGANRRGTLTPAARELFKSAYRDTFVEGYGTTPTLRELLHAIEARVTTVRTVGRRGSGFSTIMAKRPQRPTLVEWSTVRAVLERSTSRHSRYYAPDDQRSNDAAEASTELARPLLTRGVQTR